MKYGLKEKYLEQICLVFEHFPAIEKAILYGSRAMGNYRDASDIDLSLIGEALNLDQLLHLENKLDDLLLPYTIDLSIFHQIENSDLIRHIERVGVLFYDRDNMKNTY